MRSSFDFRGLSVDATRADGMSILLVPVDQYDETGADLITLAINEEPNLAGEFGFSFDTYNTDNDAQDDPEETWSLATTFRSTLMERSWLRRISMAATHWDIVTSDPSIWHNAELIVDGDNVQILITDGVDGSEHVAFDGNIPGMSAIGPVRPVFAARTGGSMDNYEIDNFKMWIGDIGIPGDHNGNGSLDAGDLDLEAAQMVRTGAAACGATPEQ